MTRPADTIRGMALALAVLGLSAIAAGCPTSPEVRQFPDTGWIDASDTATSAPDTGGQPEDTDEDTTVADTGVDPPTDTTTDTGHDPTDTTPSDTVADARDAAPDTRDTGRDTGTDTGGGASYPRWNIQPTSDDIDCAAADQCITYFCNSSFDRSCAKFYVQKAGSPGASRGSKLQACYHWKCPNRKDGCLSRVNSSGGACEAEYDSCYRSPTGDKLNCSEILECILVDCTNGSASCRQKCRDRAADGEELKFENFFGCFNEYCRGASDTATCMVQNCRPRIEGCFGC